MNARIERGQLLYQQGRYDLATQELRQALATEPGDAYAHALLALCLVMQKEYDAAEAEAGAGIAAAPDFALVHYAMSVVLSERGRSKPALAAAREAIRLDPEDADYRAVLAQLLAGEREWTPSLAAADAGLQLDPEHRGCLNLRAQALTKLGRHTEAARTMDEALARDPDNANTHANQGWACLHRGQAREALQHFREALRLEPDNEWARDGIIEALKARNPLYSLMLRYFLWMGKMKPGTQLALIVGGMLGVRMLPGLGRRVPALEPFVWPLMILYFLFVWLTWVAKPLSDLLLRLDSFGRLVLSPEKIVASNWVGACLLAAVLSLIAGVALGSTPLLLGAGVFAVLLIPLSSVFSSAPGWKRTVMAALTGVIALTGLGPVFLRLAASGSGDASPDLVPFLLLTGVSTWIANGLRVTPNTR